MPPNSVTKSTKHRYLLAFAHRDHHCRLCGRFFANGYTNINPHLLWRQSHSPPIIWASAGGLRKCTARSYRTPCTSSPPTTRLLRGRHKLCHRSVYGDTSIFGPFRAGTGPYGNLPGPGPPEYPSSSPPLHQRGRHLWTTDWIVGLHSLCRTHYPS
jgi:hypothetical protein